MDIIKQIEDEKLEKLKDLKWHIYTEEEYKQFILNVIYEEFIN